MTIKIIPGPVIHLTQEEHDRLFSEWQKSQMYTAMPVSFEIYVRQRSGK